MKTALTCLVIALLFGAVCGACDIQDYPLYSTDFGGKE